MDEAKPFVAETLRVNPSFTIKWFREHVPYDLPTRDEGLRKAGFAGGMSETRKIAAILVADVVGYSRLAGADEDRTLSRLRGLRSDLIDPAIAAHHGRIVKRTGDGSLIEFRSVVDAVRCAIEVQNGLIERNAGLPPDRRIEFRVGIHLGDVVEESDGDLMGDGVNIAARLEGICKPGAICLSEDAYRQVKGRLDLAVTDLGPTATQEHRRADPGLFACRSASPRRRSPRAGSGATPQKRRFGLAPLAAGIAALPIVIAGGAWYFLAANRPASVATKAPAEAARLSIVVLPFANLSGDPGQDYLVDALTDELTTSLARIRDSFVIARNTAMTFKGKPVDAKAIGKDLGVRYVLEGSVQPSGNRDEGQRPAHRRRQRRSPLGRAIRHAPRRSVADAGRDRHASGERNETSSSSRPRARASNGRPRPIATPRTWLSNATRAQWKAGFIGKEADAAYALCEQALAIDPNNVRALQALGVKFCMRAAVGASVDPKGDLERADELESKALALDPDWTWPHDVKGGILRLQARYQEAVAEHERALALDPSNEDAAASVGMDYAMLGRIRQKP